MDPTKIIDRLQGTGYTDINELIIDALNLLIGATAVICVAVLIFSGIMYITASGDEAKVEKATKSLTYAIVGLVIAFIAVLVVQFVLKDLLKSDAALLLTGIVA
ncbi:MAG: hypothetical protein XD93_0724 [candidate division WS6 bacterium 34_10]|uniref:Transmembrane(S)protein n=1 Tax=candidate division WS6 bacterium 34_10 TaxID=1641389 RepID=A0A117M013_9BACT|nr:MAG: hypothetical protein XD93_0724 [candidate division WS6 bacterium 34_10]